MAVYDYEFNYFLNNERIGSQTVRGIKGSTVAERAINATVELTKDLAKYNVKYDKVKLSAIVKYGR